jgi:murein L,D-transpeptidase YcbB/YkuD
MMGINRIAHASLIAATLAAAPAAGQGPMEIVVNIPAGRLDVVQGGQRVRSYPVSVGTAAHATPQGEGAIRRMVWNPDWTPPDAEWARRETRKGPGWANPMGRVKIHLFRDYYVHGTPAGNERRLGAPASHGCIRMRNRDVMELAEMVMRADGALSADATARSLAANPRNTRELSLAGRVHVRIEYRLAEVDADSVTLHPDVYGVAKPGYAARVAADLRAAGADTAPGLAAVGLSRAPASAVRIARQLPQPAGVIAVATVPATAAPAQTADAVLPR